MKKIQDLRSELRKRLDAELGFTPIQLFELVELIIDHLEKPNTINVNIENIVKTLNSARVTEDAQKTKAAITKVLLDQLKDVTEFNKSGCFRVSVGVLTKKILDGLKAGQWRDNEKHIRKCLTQNWFYTKDDMLAFATCMMDQIADISGAHEASKDDLKEWENKN